MSGIQEIARRYASALVTLASEADALKAVTHDLDQVCQLHNQHEGVRAILDSPVIPGPAKAAALNALLKRMDAHPLSLKFFGLLCKNRRLKTLAPVTEAVHALIAQRGGMVVQVRSAQPLQEQQKTALSTIIQQKLGDDAAIQYAQQEALMGGLTITVGSVVIDASLRTQLHHLQSAMRGL